LSASISLNLDEVEKYCKTDGGYLIMCDKSTVSVSRRKRDELERIFFHRSDLLRTILLITLSLLLVFIIEIIRIYLNLGGIYIFFK
jgi:hypothetical protein